jgi:trigger factor
MEPGEFIKVLDENGQIPQMMGEVARNKAIAITLGKVSVVDTDGKPVDLSGFIPSDEDDAIEDEGADESLESAADDASTDDASTDDATTDDAGSETVEEPAAADEKPAKKKSAKK